MNNLNYTIGICDASPLDATYLQKSPFVPFVRLDINKRTVPSEILPGAQSIIVIGVSNIQVVSDTNHLKPEKLAQLSSLGTNPDYHTVVKNLLTQLAAELSRYTTFRHKILVDSPTLDERAFALRAGIGFYGRNGLIISPKFGTKFNIGLLLTDIPLAPTPEQQGKCPLSCRACIDACPNNALQPDTPLNAAKCISYLTQKRDLSCEEKVMLHNQLYGCDICQDVCPFNNDFPQAKTYINPQEWLTMTDAEFAKKYGHTAMLWQGAEFLRRNARAVAANLMK